MSNTDKVQKVVGEVVEKTEDIGTSIVEDGVEKVLVAKDWLAEIESRLERAERPVLAKVKDAVVSNKRKLILTAGTVVALGAAAYAVTHKDELLEGTQLAVETTAEKAELAAQDVKKDARKARTGSTTK